MSIERLWNQLPHDTSGKGWESTCRKIVTRQLKMSVTAPLEKPGNHEKLPCDKKRGLSVLV